MTDSDLLRKSIRNQLRKTLEVYRNPEKTPAGLKQAIEDVFTQEQKKLVVLQQRQRDILLAEVSKIPKATLQKNPTLAQFKKDIEENRPIRKIVLDDLEGL